MQEGLKAKIQLQGELLNLWLHLYRKLTVLNMTMTLCYLECLQGWEDEATSRLLTTFRHCHGSGCNFEVFLFQIHPQEGRYFQTNSSVWGGYRGGLLPTAPSNSRSPAGCPQIQLNPDMTYLETASDTTGQKFSQQKLPLTAHFRCQSSAPAVSCASTRLATDWKLQ